MKGIIIVSKFWTEFFSARRAVAVTLFPFIFVLNRFYRQDSTLINHERIHLAQALELLVVPFYLWYTGEFLLHYLKYRNFKQAYLMISFEREAYHKELDYSYLKQRKRYAFMKYLKAPNCQSEKEKREDLEH